MDKQYDAIMESLKILKAIAAQLAVNTQKPVKARKKKEYTDEQRAAIRARLLEGQEAARKRRESYAERSLDKTEVKKSNKSKKDTKPETVKTDTESTPTN